TNTWTDWAATSPFIVNAQPAVPVYREPLNIAVSQYPVLSAECTDPNDAEETLIPEFAIRLQGDPGDGLVVPFSRLYRQDDRWKARTTATEFPAYDAYEWRGPASGPAGVVRSSSPVLPLTSGP